MLTLHGMVSDAVILGNPQVLLIYLSGMIGMAFSMAFFAPLWSRLPISTEGEFILWRFDGRWARRLHVLRSALLAILLIPFLMSLVLLPLREVLTGMLQLDRTISLVTIAAMLTFGALFNTFRLRVRLDRFFGTVAVLLTPLLLFHAVKGLHGLDPSAMLTGWKTWSQKVGVIDVIAPALFIWWFAQIIDLPGMTGQKLLSSKSGPAGSWGAILASLALMLIEGVFLALPLSLGYTPDQGNYFTFLGIALQGGPWLAILATFYLSTAAFILLNLQHWAGALINANLIQHHTRIRQTRASAVGAMLFTSYAGFLLLLLHDHTMDAFWECLLITAGVGPVYILRWYLPRVTAQVQFTAMVSAIGYAALWHLASSTAVGASTMARMVEHAGIPLHLLQVLSIGVATLLTAAIPYWRATEADVAHGRLRLRELHGGFAELRSPLLVALGLCVAFVSLAALPSAIGLIGW